MTTNLFLRISRPCLIGALLLFSLSYVVAQESNQTINVVKSSNEVTIDGSLEESCWHNESGFAKDFWLYFPNDSTRAPHDTKIKMAYDEKQLYIGIICSHDGKDYVIPSLKRDFRAGGNDNITLLFDPFNDGINAFMFGVNPAGVQREGLISGGGTTLDNFTVSWDQKWKSAAKITDQGWVVEVAIPFSSIRFNPNATEWRFNAYRFDMKSNERSTWINVPRNQWIFNLGYMGKMVFPDKITNEASKISIIPFATASTSKKFNQTPESPRKNTVGIGGDMKIALTSGINLDLTAFPDFSQVEVDQQVTNVDRFEIFFPERRQFFLENEDLFASYGFSNINPFFSRRIGISTNPVTKLAQQNAIFGGLRLSGKINKDWRIGLLSMQSEGNSEVNLPSFNHAMFSLQRKIGARSNIAVFSTNKMHFDQDEALNANRFNRVMGADYNLATKDNTWAGKVFYHRSFSPNQAESPFAHGATLSYINPKVLLKWSHEIVGKGYDAQSGFVRRRDYHRISPMVQYFIQSKNDLINRHGPSLLYDQVNQGRISTATDKLYTLAYSIDFANNATFELNFNRQFIYLFSNFDPTGSIKQPLLEGTDFTYNFVGGTYSSDNSKKFNYNITTSIGQYFNGNRFSNNAKVTYRFEPYVNLSMSYTYNRFDMSYLPNLVNVHLVGPTLDMSFSKSLFWTTFVQYNSQINNTNINSRLQWRFAPVSDFFLVFTNNSFTGSNGTADDRFIIQQRDQGIVAKMTYWFNS